MFSGFGNRWFLGIFGVFSLCWHQENDFFAILIEDLPLKKSKFEFPPFFETVGGGHGEAGCLWG